MKRRLIAIALGIASLLASTANARTVSLTEKSTTVTVTEKADGATEAMIVVVKSGGDADDNDNVFAMQKTSAADGIFTFTFDMQDERNGSSTDGKYDIYIGLTGKETRTGSMYYATVQSRTNLTDALKTANDAQAVKTVIETEEHQNTFAAIGCGTELYSNGDKDKICSFIATELAKENDLTEKKIAEIYNISAAASMLSNCEKSEIGTYLNLVNLSFENVNYADITDSACTAWINESVYNARPYATVDELRNIYAEANMLYKIASSRVGSIGGVIEKYAAALDITENSTYTKYKNSSKKDKADENLAALFKKSGTVDKDGFLTLLNTATANASGTTGGNGTSGGGTSGGAGTSSSGSSSTTSSVAGITTSTPSASTGTTQKTFGDMSQAAWAENAVNKLAENNLVAGYEDGNFRPNELLTREAFVKMLVAAANLYDENAECDFTDVSKDAWYYKYIASAVQKGIVNGISDTEFGIGRNITRQDMAVLAYKAYGTPPKTRDGANFADGESISEYAREAVNALYEAEIISGMGDNRFEPFGTATRAQGAVVIYNLYF